MVAIGSVHADHSSYQPALDLTYPYPNDSFRAFDGTYEDPRFRQNLRVAAQLVKAGRGLCFAAYLVYRPGKVDEQARLFRQAVLTTLGSIPRWLVAEVDVESWGGQIRGDRSAELNRSWALLVTVLGGDRRRVGGYFNRPDGQSLWPHRPSGMWVRLAAYTSKIVTGTVPNAIAQQYYGGLDYPVPPGLPRSCPPFGRHIDLNVTPGRTALQFAVAVGAILTAKTPEETDLMTANAAEYAKALTDSWARREMGGAGYDGAYFEYLVNVRAVHLDTLAEARKQTALLTRIANSLDPSSAR